MQIFPTQANFLDRAGSHPHFMRLALPPKTVQNNALLNKEQHILFILEKFHTGGQYPRLFIDRLAALSAVCLSWLGRILNLGEGGPLCAKQDSQHSTATDCSTEYTVLCWLVFFIHNGPVP